MRGSSVKASERYGNLGVWHFANGDFLVHSPLRCEGEFCSIHNPSDHHMRDWPQVWRSDRGIVERLCEHGVGHPDPDCIYAQKDSVHGCDGCCGR